MKNKISVPDVILFYEVERVLKEGKQVTLRAKGNSMLPFIRNGRDSVMLTGKFQLQKGDIVLAKTNQGTFVLHRIIRLDEQTITLMGDGNLRGTETCERKDVFGKVTAILKNGKTINPYNPWNSWKSVCWIKLLPLRRYLLAIYRRL